MSETEFRNTAEQAARIGGDVLRQWAGKFTVREKGRSDFVTEADFASQQAIYDYIRRRHPEHGFLGEEGLSEPAANTVSRWIIDPLDGTSNYVHGFPYYAVSVALEHDGELLTGAIYDPTRDELFSALRGRGATLNGKEIQPTEIDSLNAALVMVSLPVTLQRDHPALQRFLNVLPHVQHVQRTGSAALNLAYVAAGRIEAFWSTSLKPWDMAAGVVVIEEAGGRVTAIDGQSFRVDVPDILASNGSPVHGQLQSLLT